MLDREEYIEQAHFFRALGARLQRNVPAQDLLAAVREEILATTKLPLAIDFMAAEMRLHGVFHTAMEKLAHYFTPFQSYLIAEAEDDRSRFDLSLALEILRREAEYRAAGCSPQGIFLYEFEGLCRNRLKYDQGLAALGRDDVFDASWREWIDLVRRQIGLIDLADLIYVRSEYYPVLRAKQGGRTDEAIPPALFGLREGRIAAASARKDPLHLFASLQRQLGYPEVPRPTVADDAPQLLPQLARRMERLEARIKIVEEEQRGGIDLSKFYRPQGLQKRFEDEP